MTKEAEDWAEPDISEAINSFLNTTRSILFEDEWMMDSDSCGDERSFLLKVFFSR